MNRREAIKAATLGAALPVLGQSQHQHSAPQPAAAKPAPALKFFTPAQRDYVAQLAELIIPQTNTPGAKAAGVHLYIDQMLSVADTADQQRFIAGLEWLDQRATERHSAPFMKLTETQQLAILEPLATKRNMDAADQPGIRFVERIKALTITGYYTSPEGFIKELGFTQGFTGEYPGCTHPEHK